MIFAVQVFLGNKGDLIWFSAKNVLLTEEFTRAKLADYDSARWLRDEFTEAGLRPLGTKGFVAPEVFK